MDKFINPTKPAEIEIEKDEPVVVRWGQNIDQTINGIGEDLQLNFFFDTARDQTSGINVCQQELSSNLKADINHELSLKARCHSQK